MRDLLTIRPIRLPQQTLRPIRTDRNRPSRERNHTAHPCGQLSASLLRSLLKPGHYLPCGRSRTELKQTSAPGSHQQVISANNLSRSGYALSTFVSTACIHNTTDSNGCQGDERTIRDVSGGTYDQSGRPLLSDYFGCGASTCERDFSPRQSRNLRKEEERAVIANLRFLGQITCPGGVGRR